MPDYHHYLSWRSGIEDGNQTIGRHPAITSGMEKVLLKVSNVVSKPFDTGTTRPISCSGQLVLLFEALCTIF